MGNKTKMNIQNIPLRTELGEKLRKAFISPDADVEIVPWVEIDYGKIEQRILAGVTSNKPPEPLVIKDAPRRRTKAARRKA